MPELRPHVSACGHRGCRGRRACKAAPRPAPTTTTLHTEDDPMIKPPTYVAGPLGADGDGLTDMRLLALARLAVVENRLPFTLAGHQGLLLGPGPTGDRARTAVLAELARSGAYLVGNNVLGELWLFEGPDGELGDVGRAALEGFQRAGRGRVTRRGPWADFRASFTRAGDELAKLYELVGAFQVPAEGVRA